MFKIYPYKGVYPKIARSVFLGDFVTITGDVEIGEYSSIFFNTVIKL